MKSTEFLTDYIIGVYEKQGNFNNISSSKVYGTLYRRINSDKKKGEPKESVVDYVYSQIGYESIGIVSPDMVHALTAHCYYYKTISNLKSIDVYMYKKYMALVKEYEDNDASELDLLRDLNLEEYYDKPVGITARENNNKVTAALFSLYAQVLQQDPLVINELSTYFMKNKVFNLDNMKTTNTALFTKLMNMIPNYGGCNKSIKADIIMYKGMWYTKEPFTCTKQELLEDMLYMMFRVKPSGSLRAFEKYLLDLYYLRYQNFRYMYRRNPGLYKRLMSISLELRISFKDLLESQGYAYDPLTYSNIDYVARGEFIEARIANVPSNETIIMDRKVYAYLYDTDALPEITIDDLEVDTETGDKVKIRVALFNNQNQLKGKMISSIYHSCQYINFKDGNPLNISSANTEPA